MSAVLFGVADFAGGIASKTISAWRVTAWSQLIGLPVLLVALATISDTGFTATDLAFGVLAGSFGLVGIALLYQALASGAMSVVSPIVGVVSAAIPVIWSLTTGETFGTIDWIAMMAAVVAVVLIAGHRSGARPTTKILVQALAAAVSFAIFFIAIGQTSAESGLWPLLSARLVTVPIAFAVAYVSASVWRPPRDVLPHVAFIGAADIGANVAVLLAIQTGSIGITAVISGLYPAFTVLAAVLILRERPEVRQRIGIVMAIAAGAALAL